MDNKKMKRAAIIAAAAAMCFGTCLARPHGGPRGGFGGPRPMMRGGFGGGHHHHHHHSYWGRGGRGFWPGFVGGVVGGFVADAIVSPTYVAPAAPVIVNNPAPIVVNPAPVVINTAPTYTTQSVWVEGRYVDQVQANGTVVRVWQPGHYEQRQILVQ